MMRSKACHKNKSANVKAKLMAKTSPTHVLQLISASLKECIEDNKNNSQAVTEKLQKLFLSLA